MGNNYRSKFEKEFHGIFSYLKYEPVQLDYTIPHKYTPDFTSKSGKHWYELKGRFRTGAEAAKYIHIRKYLPKGVTLTFVFMNPKTPMPGAKRRGDGTRMTMVEWADKNNFIWTTIETMKKRK